jgi:hypothetical protein
MTEKKIPGRSGEAPIEPTTSYTPLYQGNEYRRKGHGTYVGVVECAPASPYTYSSSTHRFPDERTPIEATPLSATSAELGLGWGLGLGLDSLSHSSSHALPFFSPPSFHTLAFSPAFTSVAMATPWLTSARVQDKDVLLGGLWNKHGL